VARCFALSYKYFKVNKDEFSVIIKNAIKDKKLYLLTIDNKIEGFAIAYKYNDKCKYFLMIDYAAIDRRLEVKNYLFPFISLFGLLDYIFYKKIKSNKYRLLMIDYDHTMLHYVNLKERRI